MQKIINLTLILLLFLGCSSVSLLQQDLIPIDIQRKHTIILNDNPDKILYNDFNKIFYLLKRNKNEVTVLSNHKKNIINNQSSKNNIIGRITDIEIASNGGLFILDRDNRQILKFDYDGKYISSQDIGIVSDPCLFSVTSDEIAYVYDCSANRILSIDLLTNQHLFDFGDFLLDNPQMIKVHKNYIVVYDGNNSLIFTRLGQFVETFPGFIFYDNGIRFVITDNDITTEKGNFEYKISTSMEFVNITNSIMIFKQENQLILDEIIYKVYNQ